MSLEQRKIFSPWAKYFNNATNQLNKVEWSLIMCYDACKHTFMYLQNKNMSFEKRKIFSPTCDIV